MVRYLDKYCANIAHCTATQTSMRSTVTPSNGLEKLFLNLDTCKSIKEWYRVKHERVTRIQSWCSSQVRCLAVVKKKLGYFNHICRLSQLHQSGIIVRSPRNGSKIGLLKFHPSALVKLISSMRSLLWFHYWYFFHNWVTKPFPEMLIDRCSAKKTGLIKRETSQRYSYVHMHTQTQHLAIVAYIQLYQ